ncbi:MAG: dienelactone hydrolase family protein [Luteolibacter sp.]
MKTIPMIQHLKAINQYVRIAADDVFLMADLQVPEESTSLVILAYDSGRSRNHPRALHVARILRANGLATLLSDLLTEEEEAEDEVSEKYRHDVEFLAKRLIAVTKWATHNPDTKRLKKAYFGASTGGSAALIAAAKMRMNVKAVVSRGGCVDLSAKSLSRVACPTLLIVGENDIQGMESNSRAFEILTCEKELHIIPGASHLFGEPGKLEAAAQLSAKWLHQHLVDPDDCY